MSKPDGRRTRILWGLAAVAALGAIGLAIGLSLDGEADLEVGAYFTVERGPLVISVTESGTIKNREQVVIKSQVEGRAAILTLAPEGKNVEKGDLLVQLDASKLEEKLANQLITVGNAKAAFIRATKNLEIVKSQAESNNSQAALDLRFAKLDLEKYIKGDHPQRVQQADSDITIARENVERAQEKLKWSTELHGKGYLALSELQADELALKTSKINLELAEGKKAVLLKYTYTRDLEQYESDIEQAEKALDRTQQKGDADIAQAEAELVAKQSEYEKHETRKAKLEDQIEKCTVIAPVGGMVVHATTGRGRRGRTEPLEEGQEVSERQELVHLPTADSMMAEIKVHESSLDKVRRGLPVHITVDAAPGRLFKGAVQKIAVLPDSQSVWLNPDLKVYNSEVHIDGNGGDLRTGMSCSAEIFVERYEDAVQVPIQCVLRVAGRPTVFVKAPDGIEARAIEIGLDNNRRVHVLSGLKEGEKVLLVPPLESASAAPAPEPPKIEPAAPEPEEKPKAQAPAGEKIDWANLSQEERRKRFEALTPEQKQKLMDQFRNRGGGGGRPPR